MVYFNNSFTPPTHVLSSHSKAQERAEAMANIKRELSEPFNYFSHPTDQIGFEACPKATIVTYDGAFVTAYGELSFYAGIDHNLTPINHRIKTFLDGYLPVIEFGFDRDGLHYHFEAFCTPADLKATNDPITFIKCTVTNPGKSTINGQLGLNFGKTDSPINTDPKNTGFLDQRKTLNDTLDAQRSTSWNSIPYMDEKGFAASPVSSSANDSQLIANNHLVCLLPEGGQPGMADFTSNDKGACTQYNFTLKPGEKTSYEFRMPDIPIELSRSTQVNTVKKCSYEDYRAKTIQYWKNRVANADHISIDDPKVINTFKTSLVNDLIATELNQDGHLYQRVNKMQYNYMWVRDSSFIIRNYELVGDYKLAKELLHAFVVWKDGKPIEFSSPDTPQPDGARLSIQDDYWGQVLWAYAAYERTTHDMATLKQIYPILQPHINLFLKKVASDPKGLWPVAGPYDNEVINGHYTGHSFWSLLGLRSAVDMAKMMDRPEDAQNWQKIYDQYRDHFLSLLHNLVKDSQGYIPPGMDDVNAGNDWANASGGLFPFGVLSPTDPMAINTIEMVRDYNYREGIICYGGNAWTAKQAVMQGKTPNPGQLHDYEIFFITEGNTILGNEEKVVKDLYSILAHTSSTNGGFETSILPWTNRDPGGNFPPHGWFAARYMEQIRDCLVREGDRDQTLHLASVLAPAWIEAGKEVKVDRAPTYFGTVSYQLQCRADGATLNLQNHWTRSQAPEHIVFHLPWYLIVSSVTVNGKELPVSNDSVEIPLNASQVEFHWKWNFHPNLSYNEAVKSFLIKYYLKPAGANYDFLFPHSIPATKIEGN